MNVLWSTAALCDLQEIHDHISQDAPSRADDLVTNLVDVAERLETFPKSGRAVPEFNEPSIREIVHRSYRIVYRLQDGAVEIVTVLHGSRILPELATSD